MTPAEPLLMLSDAGLYCPLGNFHIDPWKPVDRAVVTHGHTDHAHWGNRHYLCSPATGAIIRARFGDEKSVQALAYGEPLRLGSVRVSLHPAGHVLGSAQVCIESDAPAPIDVHDGVNRWSPKEVRRLVISGDFKREADPAAEPFEPVMCDAFITESTFGLPIYRWPSAERVFEEVNAWWRGNIERGRTSVIYAYALGKAQRLLAGVDASIGPIVLHGAVANLLPAYEAAGVKLPETSPGGLDEARRFRGKALVIAPQSAMHTPWLRKFAPLSQASASGWSLVRGPRRRLSLDRGFVLSDHADWPSLLRTIDETGARSVGVTHGFAGPLARWLRDRGLDAQPIATRFHGEHGAEEVEAAA